MAVTVQMQFESAVTEMYQDAFVGSSIENGATIISFDLRQHDFQQELGATATLVWRKESYHVDIHELSTFVPQSNKVSFHLSPGVLSGCPEPTPVLYASHSGRLDSPAYEPQHYPLGMLSGSGVRCQSQAHGSALFRALSDSHYQVVDQEMD
jgi:hypothetical protein